ncbi:hypothetical protein [uncultured Corynebacterium sp.]|uniref:hypothetical protein n=1 Tax=uncultured Corynebacterium sp. TaxID=159447 RepID=UPI0025DDE00E|nr:hypothetical protein [uncultured Corynebacterium sp.]
MSTLSQQIESAAEYSAASHALMLGAAFSGVLYHPVVSGNQLKIDVMRASGVEWDPLRESADTLRRMIPYFMAVRSSGGRASDSLVDVAEGLISEAVDKVGEWLISLADGHSATAESSDACADALQSVMEDTDSAMEDVVDLFTTVVETGLPLILPLPPPTNKIAMHALTQVGNAAGLLLLSQVKARDRAIGEALGTLSTHCSEQVSVCGACRVEPPKPLQHCDAVTSRGGDGVLSVVPRNESSPIVSVCPSPGTPVSPGTSMPMSSCELSTGQRESANRLQPANEEQSTDQRDSSVPSRQPASSPSASSCQSPSSSQCSPSAQSEAESVQKVTPKSSDGSSSGRTCTQMASGLIIESTQGAPGWNQKTPESSALSGGESGSAEGTRVPSSIRLDVSVQQPLEAAAEEEVHVDPPKETAPGTTADDTASHLGITVEKAGAW